MQVKKQQLELDMEQQTGAKLGKELRHGCILSPCLFNIYAEYIMRNAGLDEAQAGIKTAGEIAIIFLMKMKESEKGGLKLNIQKTKIMASGPITSWQIDGKTNGNSERLYFLGLQNHCRW